MLVFYTACHTMKTRVPGEPTAIDDINNEKEVVDWPNPLMKDLQNACRLSNFSVDYLLTEAKNMTDREYERSMDRSYNEWLRLLVSFIKKRIY